jgi:hypothetical protein
MAILLLDAAIGVSIGGRVQERIDEQKAKVKLSGVRSSVGAGRPGGNIR